MESYLNSDIFIVDNESSIKSNTANFLEDSISSRKLASIQLISAVNPIENADAIECVTINGWKCVSKNGVFKEGDLCVYFEIDSFLPIEERFEFLRKSSYKKLMDKEGFRLRTVRLRGQISQGLALPVDIFEELKTYYVGDDVTEVLNIIKYDPPIPANIAGDVVGRMPSFIPKTDEERIQNLPEYFTEFKGVLFEETMKLDGTSMTVFCRRLETPLDAKDGRYVTYDGKHEIGVCMRNYELKYNKDNTMWKTALELRLESILSEMKHDIAIQGELMGYGIQKNREKLTKHEFYIFRMWNIEKQEFIDPEVRDIIMTRLNEYHDLKHVPVINLSIDIFNEVTNMDDMLLRADGKSITHKYREGIVFKSCGKINGRTVTFKVISNKFLLKQD